MQNGDEVKTGVVYIVATPIGNLKDMTIRGIEVLKGVHLVAAEDTRRARILLDAYGITTPVTSLFEHNEDKKSAVLTSLLLTGKDIAYITDAGTPGISDPGYVLVRQAIKNGIRVIPIPGASAVIAGLSAAGIPAGSFIFDGYIPPSSAKRKKYYEGVRHEKRAIVLYESPRRLLSSLADMKEVLGERQVVMLRELTKVFEEIVRGGITELMARIAQGSVRGEITLILSPDRTKAVAEIPETAVIRRLFDKKTKGGCSGRDAIDAIARELDIPRKQIYELVFSEKKK
ncbi:MAG: 16S rRNA (cytidine(1402)-2'-O)-methyltransferase [Smithellaceae bacterium]|nr:16S rRNA (cytidine(1402)-2'-O)-methyltransferase [Smithellaceae bacterium]